MSNDCPIAMT